MKRVVLSSVLFALGSLVLTATATAGVESSSYAGSQCQSATNHNLYSLNFSQVRNTSTSTPLQVDCPIHATTSGTIAGFINVRDRHPTANFTCSFTSVRDDLAGLFGFSNTLSSSGLNAVPQELSFPSHPAATNLYHFIGCSIPANAGFGVSEIISYASLAVDL